jgi:hypothetical protein
MQITDSRQRSMLRRQDGKNPAHPCGNDALTLLVGQRSSGLHHYGHRAGNVTVVCEAMGAIKRDHGSVHIIACRTQGQCRILGAPGCFRVMEVGEGIAFVET